jgi:hypothetical protein
MALIECPECKHQISDKAPACPKCGVPIASTLSVPTTETTVLPEVSGPAKNDFKVRPVFLVLIVVAAAVIFWLWRSATSERAAPPSAGLSGALRQPKKVVDERIELNEGQSMSYSFRLGTDARVRVQVTAEPKNVDVMLMSKEEQEKFHQVMGKLFGGQYTYRQALSSKLILRMDKTEVVPVGEWSIVVMRPQESLLLHEKTTANIVVTVY